MKKKNQRKLTNLKAYFLNELLDKQCHTCKSIFDKKLNSCPTCGSKYDENVASIVNEETMSIKSGETYNKKENDIKEQALLNTTDFYVENESDYQSNS